jgi:hypothetical protein
MKSAVGLHRPISRKPLPQHLVFRAVTKLLSHAGQRIKQFLKLHIQCTRDHTRGLLEACASIAESAVHAFKDVAVVFAHWHERPPVFIVFAMSNRFQGFGETDSLHSYHLSRGLWSALLIENHAQASKDSPRLFQPKDAQNQKSIFYHSPRQPATGDRKLELSTLTR